MTNTTIPRSTLLRPASLVGLGLAATALLTGCGASDETIASGDGNDETVSTVNDGSTTTTEELPLGSGPYPVGTLEIEITHPDADTVTYTVSCLGDTATVTGEVDVDERVACTALALDDVQTRLVEGAPAGQACTEIYGGPDEAHITGTLDEQPVDTTIDRANGCGISDWDTLLAGVLPPALGVTE